MSATIEHIGLDAGNQLTRAFYNRLWHADQNDESLKPLIEQGLLEIRPEDGRDNGVECGYITELGRKRIAAGGVPHHPYAVPFEHRDLPAQLDIIEAILNDPELDDDQFSIPSIHEAVRGMVNVYTFTDGQRVGVPEVKLSECGSVELEDSSEKSLYRALWLFRPKGVDFDDMYKTRLFWVASKDHRFWISFELYKYELALYFYADTNLVGGKQSGVICGVPGSNNGLSIQDHLGRRFFDVMTRVLNTTHDVYPGNNFSV